MPTPTTSILALTVVGLVPRILHVTWIISAVAIVRATDESV